MSIRRFASELKSRLAAWGGADSELSAGLRVASGIAALVWAGAALLVLARAGYFGERQESRLLRRGTRLLAAVLLASALLNFASSSAWERFGWGPLGFALSGLTFAVGRGRLQVRS